MSEEYLTVEKARTEFDLSKAAIAKLIDKGELPWKAHPFDGRIKLVSRTDMERVAAIPRAKKAGAVAA